MIRPAFVPISSRFNFAGICAQYRIQNSWVTQLLVVTNLCVQLCTEHIHRQCMAGQCMPCPRLAVICVSVQCDHAAGAAQTQCERILGQEHRSQHSRFSDMNPRRSARPANLPRTQDAAAVQLASRTSSAQYSLTCIPGQKSSLIYGFLCAEGTFSLCYADCAGRDPTCCPSVASAFS